MDDADNEDRYVVTLPEDLDLTRANVLAETLKQAFATDRPVEVDGSAVLGISTAGLQVLIAAAHQARVTDIPFRLARPSQSLISIHEDLGLAHWLEEWSDTP